MVVSMKAEGKRKADKHVKADTKALACCQPRQTNALKHLFENVFIDFCCKTHRELTWCTRSGSQQRNKKFGHKEKKKLCNQSAFQRQKSDISVCSGSLQFLSMCNSRLKNKTNVGLRLNNVLSTTKIPNPKLHFGFDEEISGTYLLTRFT